VQSGIAPDICGYRSVSPAAFVGDAALRFCGGKRAVELELATILQLVAAQAGGDFLTGKNYRYRTAAFTLW
jgi:hypothetical protein